MFRLSLLAATAAATLAGTVAASAAHIDWPTYGFDSLRTSFNPSETTITPINVTGLKQLWSFNAGAFDTAQNPLLTASASVIGGQPIVAAGVTTAGGSTDLVLVGDNNGSFFALDANSASPTGTVVWSRTLGTKAVGAPINRSFGIRSTATLDHAGASAVYVGDNVQVFGLDLATGATLPGWPVSDLTVNSPDTDGEMHDALNYVGGYIYLGTSGVGQDQPPYYGRVVVISTAKQKVATNWYPLSGTSQQPTISGGGIWGWGGIAVEPNQRTGGVYVGTGNAVGTGQQQQVYAENVVNLSRSLATIAGAAAPTYPPTGDDDFGSTPLVFTPQGCSQKLLVIKSKTGAIVVETVAANGTLALANTLQVSTSGGTEFKGTAAFDAADQLVMLTIDTAGPSPYTAGLAAFNVSCAAPYLSLAWEASKRPNGQPIMSDGGHISSPTVANGLVFFGAETPATKGNSVVYAVLTKTSGGRAPGTVVFSSGVIPGTFDSALPTVVNGQVLFSTVSTQPTIYAYGLPAGSARAP